MAEQHTDEQIENSAGLVRPRKRISTARLLLYLSILLVLLLMVLRIVPEVMLSRTISQIRAAGYPTDLQEFIAQFAPPMEGVNGEPILREALSLMVEPEIAVPGTVPLTDQLSAMLIQRMPGVTELERANLLPEIGEVELSPLGLGDRWPEEVIDALRDYITANHAAIEKLRSAHGADYFFRDEIRTTTDLEVYLGIDQGGKYRRLARSLSKPYFDLAVLERRADDALVGLEGIILSTAVLRDTPLILNKLVELSILHLFMDSSDSLLSSVSLTEQQLEQFQTMLKGIDPAQGIFAAIGFETLWSLELPGLMRKYSGGGWSSDNLTFRFRLYSGLLSLNRSIMLEEQLQLAEVLRASLDKWELEWTEIGSASRSLPPYLTVIADSYGSYHSLGALVELIRGVEIRRSSGLAAIGVERYLREHGRLPGSLNDLVPDFLDAVPLNPALGTPLEYLVVDDRYFIFGSVDSHPVPNPIERNNSGYWVLTGPGRPVGFTVRFDGRDE